MPEKMRALLAGLKVRVPHPARRTSVLLVATSMSLYVLGGAPAFATTTPGTITGSFTVPAGTFDPSDVNVELIDESGEIVSSGNVTDTSTTAATYSILGVTPGQYYVYFNDGFSLDNVAPDYYGDSGIDDIQKASLVTVSPGVATVLGGVTLTTGTKITGTVVDANRANESFASVSVSLVASGASPDPHLGGGSDVSFTDGSYSISGLPAGTYRLRYYSPGSNFTINAYVDGSSVTYDFGSATELALGAGGSTIENFSVPAVGVISGTVSGPNGPAGDDSVAVYDALGNEVAGTNTEMDGTYSVSVLPGTYKLSFGGLTAPNLGGIWYGGSTQAQAAAVTVSAGGTTGNINATLGAAGTISGTVVAAEGAVPLGGIGVELLDAQGNDVDDTFTQPDGTFTLATVPAGTWYIEFVGGEAYSGSYYATEFYGGTLTEFGAEALTVGAGQVLTNIDGAMLPEGTAALGLPTATAARLSGLHNDKVALSFRLAAGSGAGYLKSFEVLLPKGFRWNAGRLKTHLSLGSGVTFTHAVSGGQLTVTLSSGLRKVGFRLKAGGISVTRAIETSAGGTLTRKKHKGTKHKKASKAKDTIRSEAIDLSVTDTAGTTTSLPITISHPR